MFGSFTLSHSNPLISNKSLVSALSIIGPIQGIE
jgi:hypothetical protein